MDLIFKMLLPVLVVGVLFGLLLCVWKKVPQDVAMVVTGLKKRIISGGGGLVIPFFERTDSISLENMQVDVDSNSAITSTGVEIMVDGVAVVKVGAETEKEKAILTAMEQFNAGDKAKTIVKITSTVKDVLEGNMREIIATLTVEEIYQDRQAFLEKVKSSAMEDLSKMGLQIISVNIKGIKDPHGYLQALGRPRIAEVKMNAEISEAESARETSIKTSEAKKEGEKAKIEAEIKIAESNKEKEIKVQEYKKQSDASKAQADLSYQIQTNISKKEVVETDMDQQIIQKKKEIELMDEEKRRKQKELEISVTLPAEAKKLANIIEAEAEARKIKEIAIANADKLILEGESEAKKILAIGEAEASAMKEKAAAYKNYNQAAVFSMMIDKLPQIVENAAKPISAIDKIVVVDSGSQGSGASKITKMTQNIFGETSEILEAMTGFNIKDIMGSAMKNGNLLKDKKISSTENIIEDIEAANFKKIKINESTKEELSGTENNE